MRTILLYILLITNIFSKEYIAIIDMEGININDNVANALTQRLTSEIIRLEMYQVLERSEMKKLLDEQKFQYSGCVSTQCAVDIGKMLGAKFMIVGSISKVGKTYSIDARLIDVETSESYISANYLTQSSVDNLMSFGMISIAHQLSEKELIKEKFSLFKMINNHKGKITFVWIVLWLTWGWMPPPV